MASAADKRQLEAIKGLIRRWSSDAVQLRFVVVVALFGIGLFGLVRPLSARLESARDANKEARTQARLAEELRHFHEQSKEYGSRLTYSSDLVDWQTYVLETLRCTSVTLISLEPKSPQQKAPFTVLDMELVVRGTSFTEFADFASRLEHGERCVRIERVKVERQQTSMFLTMVIRGLVRTTAEEKPEKDEARDEANVAKGKDGKGTKLGKGGAADKTAAAKEKQAKGAAPAKEQRSPLTEAREEADAPADATPRAAEDTHAADAAAPEGGGDA